MNTTRGPRIAVIGAGIGGLTLAIALQRYGLDIDIYEQAAELREVGAAVALSANGTRFFELAGLGPRLASHWFEVSALVYRDGRTGRLIGHHPAGTAYRERFGAPYIGIHRADLQAVLSGAVGVDRIQLCKRLVGIDDSGARAALRFDDGSRAEADLVVGADGARSFVRRWMLGYDDALYTGCSGFRGIVPMDRVPSLPDPTALQFWVGPGGHLLHYPMGNGHINFLLVERHPTPWPARDWVMPATEGEQLRHFAKWHPAVVEMITANPVSSRWGLFHRPPLGRWTRGRVTLLGDAAHQWRHTTDRERTSRSRTRSCSRRALAGQARVRSPTPSSATKDYGGAARARSSTPRSVPPMSCTSPTVRTPAGGMSGSDRPRARCIISAGFTSSTPATRNPANARVERGCNRVTLAAGLTSVVSRWSLVVPRRLSCD